MYEQAFKNIDNALYKDAGCDSELDYIEQTSWILFLKYLDDYETDKEVAARLNGESFTRIIEGDFQWRRWACPIKSDATLDYSVAMTGDDLKDFVHGRLFPYLASFKQSAEDPKTLQYKIGEIYSQLKNKIDTGYTIREVLNQVDQLRFLTNDDKHELSGLYEDKIKNMGNAGRNGGQYYTPRALIQAIVEVVNPKIGEKVYDGAVGSAGFLCEAYEWMRKSKELTSSEYELLQKDTFIGKEKKSLAYVIGTMNMILHGIEAPNIMRTNTLAENLSDIQQKDRVDIVLANPPFGAAEIAELETNFPIKTGETAYLFLQHFVKILKIGGRCGLVIKNTFLSNSDNASIALRKQLLEETNLFAILDLPNTPFTGTGVKTVVLFFEKGKPTEQIQYYQLNPNLKFGKKTPLKNEHLLDFVDAVKHSRINENSWIVNASDLNSTSWDLTVNNPNRVEEVDNRTPQEIIAEIEALDAQAADALQAIKELL